ncbi:MAG: gliding motility lipoprotein GldH [Flavobacteriaceae bacterium]|jgi:gliding motility-associated lipoprotein GldH|nr:gliding motility lipoprotein GldH [Flavobacteriaceae bacterium]MDG1961574.1 gliding motility lipoprotein GldH [Flavobacteriaceae bacterium]
MRLSAGLFVFAALIILGCAPAPVASDVRALEDSWNAYQGVDFELPVLDSLAQYSAHITLRNTNQYPYNNIFLIVRLTHPHGKIQTDTLEYRMARADGSWLGVGVGAIKDNLLTYRDTISFEEGSGYQLSIKHALRNNGSAQGVSVLEGITEVGYQIRELNP